MMARLRPVPSIRSKPGYDGGEYCEGPETIRDLGASVPTGTFTVFPGCAGLLIGFADKLIDEAILA